MLGEFIILVLHGFPNLYVLFHTSPREGGSWRKGQFGFLGMRDGISNHSIMRSGDSKKNGQEVDERRNITFQRGMETCC